jgi:hypothetical protein
MSLKSNVYRVALGFFLVLSMSVFAFADTIRLKDGSIIKGKIINFGEGKFTVLIGEGPRQRQMNFFADEVESIEFEAIPLPATNVKTSLPTYNTSTTKKEPELKNNTTSSLPTTDEPKPTPSKSVVITDNTIGSSQTNNPQTVPTQPKPTPSQTVPTNTQIVNNSTTSNNSNPTPKTDSASKAIMLNVKVLADNTSNGWTNSGWVVKKGQKIRITGNGRINLGSGRYASAAGVSSLPDNDKLVKTEATGGLIAVIGDDNNDFIFVGASREFIAPRDGALFLGVNEGNLDDNSGSFEVTIEIQP